MGIRFDMPVVEPPLPDVYVTGITRIEQLRDGVLRLVLECEQTGPIGGQERMVVAKLLWSVSDLPEAVRRIAHAAAGNGVLCSCRMGAKCH